MNKSKALVLGVGPALGLGGALCTKFADEGMQVFVAGRTSEKLDVVCADINAKGGEAIPVQCDATQEDQVKSLFETVATTGAGNLELAVFNVGNSMPGKIQQMTAEYFERAWRMGAYAGFLFAQQAANTMLPLMAERLFTLEPVLR